MKIDVVVEPVEHKTMKYKSIKMYGVKDEATRLTIKCEQILHRILFPYEEKHDKIQVILQLNDDKLKPNRF